MKKFIATFLILTGPLCASDNYGLEILNKEKKRGEPTYAIIGNGNNKQLKVYNGTVSNKDVNKYIKENGLTRIAFDQCDISTLEKYPGITILYITNSAIKGYTQDAFNELIKLTITNNKIANKVDTYLKCIKKNENIIFKNNVLIEDANNINN